MSDGQGRRPPGARIVMGPGGQMEIAWTWSTEMPVDLPEHSGKCHDQGWRAPFGKCPAFHCKWNLVLETHRSKKEERISVGARGGKGKGISIMSRRDTRGLMRGARMVRRLGEVGDAAMERLERMTSTCQWDYVDDPELAPGVRPSEEERDRGVKMTNAQIARVLDESREAVRRTVKSGLMKLKRAAAEMAGREAEECQPRNVVPLVRVRRKADR